MNSVARKESNRQKGKNALKRVEKRIATRDGLGDHWEFERDGKVSRVDLQEACEIGPSVMEKGRNPDIKAAVRATERRWYVEGNADSESLKREGYPLNPAAVSPETLEA